jgi:hypothetical protein
LPWLATVIAGLRQTMPNPALLVQQIFLVRQEINSFTQHNVPGKYTTHES